MNTIIIDDEKLARENLKETLKKISPSLTIIAEADSVETGLEVLNKYKPDLVFLDINLFDGSGFNVLEGLNKVDFQVIFVTAYDEFAIKAFRADALDYILKPISVTELSNAVQKAIDNHARMLNKGKKKPENKRITIKENSGIRFINIDEIIRCKSDNNYTDIILKSGEKILSSRTLKEYATLLEEHDFYRIHQSHLVNLLMIKRIVKRDGYYVELENGETLEVSRRRKEGLLLKLGTM